MGLRHDRNEAASVVAIVLSGLGTEELRFLEMISAMAW